MWRTAPARSVFRGHVKREGENRERKEAENAQKRFIKKTN